MNEDARQLELYATSGSQDAFTALVERNLGLVYRAALRRLGGDRHRAEDVTQLVFTALARNARHLARHPDLTAWLFTTTRFLAAKAIRAESRRLRWEEAASVASAVEESDFTAAVGLQSVIDDVLVELREVDRQVILLRFYRSLRLTEIATQLQLTDNAVQKRLDRALDALRQKLTARGIGSTASAVLLALETQNAVALPAGLLAASTHAAIACGTAAVGVSLPLGFMVVSKAQLGLAAAVIIATSTALVWDHMRTRDRLSAQATAFARATDSLKQQLTAQTRRADAAEEDVTRLLTAVQTAAPAGPPPTPAPAAKDSRALFQTANIQGNQLRQQGKLQEALDVYLAAYRQMPPGPVYGQLLIGMIHNLSRTFPPALVALHELRGSALNRYLANPSDPAVASEVAKLNERLGDNARTIALYDAAPPDSPARQTFAAIGSAGFVDARRYDDATVGKTYGSMLNEFEMGIRHSAQTPDQAGRDFVINGTAQNIEILAGAGKADEARGLAARLRAFDNSAATQALIKARLDRAARPPN